MSKKDKVIEILKKLDLESKMPTGIELSIDKDEYGDLIDSMLEDGLISGIKPVRGGAGNKVLMIPLDRYKISIRGMDYLECNTKSSTNVEVVYKI
ncbi:iron-containing alcohol dehydrogenase [Clostridium sp. FP1]|uniref:iron-containing alcohol dehydrogenase n=1 Tax=Clostridium sp. FP1 TaxID=2724076 RepID=UPI0013E98A90|nr:iron-containing alcohol dehydrogenase [Clostridium sp. FP1]MBZ9635515.1 hypothetical protein [Clostridium sp. FP1]